MRLSFFTLKGDTLDQAIIMMAYQDFNDYELEENIEELQNLAIACEIETMDVLVQNLKKKNNATYIGKEGMAYPRQWSKRQRGGDVCTSSCKVEAAAGF